MVAVLMARALFSGRRRRRREGRRTVLPTMEAFSGLLGQIRWFRREKDGDDGVIAAVVGRTERRRRFFFSFGERERVGLIFFYMPPLYSLKCGALEVTELTYLDMTDRVLDRYLEVALMGSCLLVALMRDEDVYVMKVGDNHAIVAKYEPEEVSSSSESKGSCDGELTVGKIRA
ncbi:hypothetical protein FXO38_17696 [Capsicum annuum]|nr:hypothetical protein FXO38_17696 [Capsicum annuum]KAF3670432.1 hypothetical protein FXO37_08561 [Capsicum annuum]